MSDVTPAPTEVPQVPPVPPVPVPAPVVSEYKPPASQEELDRIIADRLGRQKSKFSDYDDLKAKADKLAEFEDAQKTEQQRLTDQLKAAQEQSAQFEQQLTRTQAESQRNALAARYGIGPDYFRYIVGDTPEEREEAAVGIAQMLQAAKGVTPTAPPSNRPQEALRPGASPADPAIPDNSYPEGWLPQRRSTA